MCLSQSRISQCHLYLVYCSDMAVVDRVYLTQVAVDATAGTLSDPRQRFLGSKPVKLFRIQVQDKRGVSCSSCSLLETLHENSPFFDDSALACFTRWCVHDKLGVLKGRRMVVIRDSTGSSSCWPHELTLVVVVHYFLPLSHVRTLQFMWLCPHVLYKPCQRCALLHFAGVSPVVEVVVVLQLPGAVPNDALKLRFARVRGGVLNGDVSRRRCSGVWGEASHLWSGTVG